MGDIKKTMKLIAHRGLFKGPDKEKENNPKQIELALSYGYDCEIDLFKIQNKIYLGHDEPQHEIDVDFLKLPGLWIHAKNVEALYFLLDYSDIYNFFWHENDQYTLTSQGFIWTFPGKQLTDKSVMVMPEYVDLDLKNVTKFTCYGICSDYVELIKEILYENVNSMR